MKMWPPNLSSSFHFLLVILVGLDRCWAIKWLALYRIPFRPWTTGRNCSKSLGLVSRQVRFCRDNLDLMPSVTQSAFQSVKTCQKQFTDRRWNCSSILKVPHMPRDLVRGTREQAFVYGIASSALVFSVSRACSVGASTKCSCGPLPTTIPTENFKWGGCGDDVRYGLAFGQAFTDASLRSKKGKVKSSKKALMNKHNFSVGRKVVAASIIRACKCHGVSGSCSMQTCWRALPNFDTIGKTLKDRYALAVEVRRKKRKKVKVLLPIHKTRKPIGADELVYYEKSPDYCSPDPKTGSVGTRSRLCDPRPGSLGNCDSMCCGRGHENFTKKVVERCECKYYWCCYVKCKKCTITLNLSRCR